MQRAGMEGSSFQQLPDEIIWKIASHVCSTAASPADFLVLPFVCRQWRHVARDPALLAGASLGAVAVRAGQWEGGRAFLRRAAEGGSLHAACMLGVILFYCVPEARSEGGRLLVSAGRAGHAAALFAAAIMSFNGSGWGRATKDLRMGVALCARSAALGNVEAMRELGHCLLDGFGTKQDQGEGWRLLLQAHLMEIMGTGGRERGRERGRGRGEGEGGEGGPAMKRRKVEGGGEGGRGGREMGCVDLFGNGRPMAPAEQQAVLQELLQRRQTRVSRAAIASFVKSRTPAMKDDCGGEMGGVAVEGGEGQEQEEGCSVCHGGRERETDSHVGLGVSGDCIPESSETVTASGVHDIPSRHVSLQGSLREGHPMEREAEERGMRGVGERARERVQPRSIAARSITAAGASSAAAMAGRSSFSAPRSAAARAAMAAISGRHVAGGDESSASSIGLPFSAKRAGVPGRRGGREGEGEGEGVGEGEGDVSTSAAAEEERVKIVQMLAAGVVPDISTKGLKNILGCLQTSVTRRPPHPANVFLMEWFGGKEGEGREGALGKIEEGLEFCGREACGRPETRKMEFWRCSCCWSARYCSRSCQLHDWRLRHSAVCRPSAFRAPDQE